MNKIYAYIKLLRPKHWIKNLLIFMPIFFDFQFFGIAFFNTLKVFIIFCMATSMVYIVNDINDFERDKAHPTKCKRPIASGMISQKEGFVLFLLLFAIEVILMIRLNSLWLILVICFYIIINLVYSFGLKNIPILDIIILSLGYILRILIGSIVNNINSSFWLYIVVMCGSFCFGLGKRRGEIRNKNIIGETRKVLSSYTEKFLDKNMYLCMTLLNVFYALWAIDTVQAKGRSFLLWTFPIVLIITMKYSFNVERESDGDPIEVLFKDKWLLVLCAAYVIVLFLIFYFEKFF